MILAVIPPRGGSKRIPHKNIKLFMGQPIISYSINAAKSCGLFDKIKYSTDSKEIAEVAEKCGAEIPFFRPAELSDDFTGTDEVILHALNWFINKDMNIDYVCCIYATAPFVKPEHIREGFKILRKGGSTSSFPVTTYPYPIYRSLKINSMGKLEMLWPEHFKTRSQDLIEAYHDAGQFIGQMLKNILSKSAFSQSQPHLLLYPVTWCRILIQ